MDPKKDMPGDSTCTTCEFSEDFSNYWTAILYFKARNGTYKRVPQRPNAGFEGANNGMTVYYMQDPLYDTAQKSKVTAFKPVCLQVLPLKSSGSLLTLRTGISHVHRRHLRQDTG